MKWKSPPPKPPIAEGSTRVIRVFLFLPKEIQGEIRWLEWATIKQGFFKYYGGSDGMGGWHVSWDWRDIDWVD